MSRTSLFSNRAPACGVAIPNELERLSPLWVTKPVPCGHLRFEYHVIRDGFQVVQDLSFRGFVYDPGAEVKDSVAISSAGYCKDDRLIRKGAGIMTRLRRPAFYIGRTSDGYPLQTQLPEGITMPVFSTSDAALQWMDAYGLGHDEYTVKGFYTLEDVRRFALLYESGFQRIAINPAPDPNVPPNLHPFAKLVEIADAEAE